MQGWWTDDGALDALRKEGDPPADALVEEYFDAQEVGSPAQLVGRLARTASGHPDFSVGPPLLGAYVADRPLLPPWADEDKIAAGQEFFAAWGTHVFNALYGAALPSAYACAKGVQVLHLTARLATDAKRRLNETAQFHLDVMEPGGLVPGATGWQDIRHVRLMHAAVRWLIEHDPGITAEPHSSGLQWDPAWGRPINQEDLVETLLTFTEVVFEVFDRTGVKYTPAQADAYLHTWSVVGAVLGIREDLLPLNRTMASELMAVVRPRQFAASDAGREMTAALLSQAQTMLPRPFRGLPRSALRWYVGDATADLLGVPAADWSKVLFSPMAKMTRLVSLEKAHRGAMRRVSDRLGRGMLELAVRAERSGARPAFAIPASLADRWGVQHLPTRP